MKGRKTIYGILIPIMAMLFCPLSACALAEGVHTVKEISGGNILVLSMGDALSKALSDNLTVRTASEDIKRAKGDSRSNSSGLRPTFHMEGYRQRGDSFNDDTSDEKSLEAILSYKLYSGGENKALAEQGRLGIEQAEMELYDTRESVALDVWEAFCDVLYKKAVLAAAEDALEYYAKAEDEQLRRVELGMSTKLDLTRMKQQLENARAERISAGNNLESARIALCKLIRIPPEQPVELKGSLSDGLPDRGSILTSKSVMDDAYAKALELRGDYRSLVLQVQTARQEVVVARSGMRPDITISGGHEYDNISSSNSLTDTDEWTVALDVTIPLYDGGESKGDVESARSEVKQAEQSVMDKEDEIKANLLKTRLSLMNALETAESGKMNVKYAQESLSYAETGYSEGVSSQLDVIQARSDLTEAKEQLAEYLMDCRNAQAELWQVSGELVNKVLGEDLGN